MDNNQNFGQQPQQPQMQQPQQMQQPVNNNPYGQQPMNNGPFGQQYTQPKQPSNINMLELISIICSGVGFLMVIFGTIFTCTCSAKKVSDAGVSALKDGPYSLSAIFILTIFGILVCAAGIVLAILALKQQNAPVKAGKLSQISAIIGAAGVVFGILPLITICGYNCSLNSEYTSQLDDTLGSLGSLFD